jgi:N-acetylglucosaminyldiphosphoundecaprenol N-acetyl-beta-D-mannosaminyltransferase
MYQYEYDSAVDVGEESSHLFHAGSSNVAVAAAPAEYLDDQQDASLHLCARGESTQIVNGIRFDLLDREDLGRIVQSFVRCGESHVVHFLAVDPTVRAAQDDSYRAVLNDGDLNIADGQPIAWAIRLRGRRTERIAGTDGVTLLCEGGLRARRSHYLYGGSELVNERLRFQLRRRHAGIRIVGAEAPPWGMPSEQELAASAARIKASGAELLWIGVGTPNQHYVASRLRDLGAAPVILCVGAAFDFVSGTKKRAPEWLQKLGLEWCHRLLSEPRRLAGRYLVGNPRFVAGIVREWLSSGHR